jgi:hypothetical protein
MRPRRALAAPLLVGGRRFRFAEVLPTSARNLMSLPRSFVACAPAVLIGAFVSFNALDARAADAGANTCTWTGPSGGDWSDPANWSCTAGSIPGAGDTAVFPLRDGGTSIAVSEPQAVGTLDVTGRGYTFSPSDAGVLTIGTGATFAGGTAYYDYLTAPIAIGSPVTFS